VGKTNPDIQYFDASCFDGDYITGDITSEYLDEIEAAREKGKVNPDDDVSQLDLDLVANQ
jgi:amidophosphoribosyltransferase